MNIPFEFVDEECSQTNKHHRKEHQHGRATMDGVGSHQWCYRITETSIPHERHTVHYSPKPVLTVQCTADTSCTDAQTPCYSTNNVAIPQHLGDAIPFIHSPHYVALRILIKFNIVYYMYVVYFLQH